MRERGRRKRGGGEEGGGGGKGVEAYAARRPNEKCLICFYKAVLLRPSDLRVLPPSHCLILHGDPFCGSREGGDNFRIPPSRDVGQRGLGRMKTAGFLRNLTLFGPSAVVAGGPGVGVIFNAHSLLLCSFPLMSFACALGLNPPPPTATAEGKTLRAPHVNALTGFMVGILTHDPAGWNGVIMRHFRT